jgi:hemoglobin-like flavoprotein
MTTFDEHMQRNADADAGLQAAIAAYAAARAGVDVPARSVVSRIADRRRQRAVRRSTSDHRAA